ncbi:hypothetical protein B0H14DRAFT_2618357 [Mycena olivaceomarginata]|nr:hypothetical protein B0H14DRAFT_2618357 [Mycena olivaceomarginata]
MNYSHIPGIWSPEQIAVWKSVRQAMHVKGSVIFMQLWALGRAANRAQLQSEDSWLPYVSASDVPLSSRTGILRALTMAEAAKNSIEAGFDGVEVHGSYLVDQFLQDVSNKRTDHYGGGFENRARFALEVIDAVAAAIRFSPWSPFQEREAAAYESNDALRALWAPRPFVRAGSFTRESVLEAAESGDLIAFGRQYISNLSFIYSRTPVGLENYVPLTVYDRSTFYLVGENSPAMIH